MGGNFGLAVAIGGIAVGAGVDDVITEVLTSAAVLVGFGVRLAVGAAIAQMLRQSLANQTFHLPGPSAVAFETRGVAASAWQV